MTSDVIARKLGSAEGGTVETLERNYVMPAVTLKSTPFLRLALLGDAAATGATGLLLATAAGPLFRAFRSLHPRARRFSSAG